MRRNPIEIQYQLIIGRSAEKNDNESRKKYLKLLSEDSGIEILTYDTLINWYKNAPRTKKNILRLSRDFYKIHKMHVEPEHIFAYVGPDKLSLTTEQRDQLIASGYEMSKWSQGDLLTYNIKYASSTWQQELDNGSIFDLPGV